MKKNLTIIVVIVSLIVTARAQNPVEQDRVLPRDSMPDLWVITMDMSGSMASSSVRGNLHSIPNKISSLVKKYGNTDKDDFVLFKKIYRLICVLSPSLVSDSLRPRGLICVCICMFAHI